MLKGIDPVLSGELLRVLDEMGHGDQLALVDRNYPAAASGRPVIRLGEVTVARALTAILSVFPLRQIRGASAGKNGGRRGPDRIRLCSGRSPWDCACSPLPVARLGASSRAWTFTGGPVSAPQSFTHSRTGRGAASSFRRASCSPMPERSVSLSAPSRRSSLHSGRADRSSSQTTRIARTKATSSWRRSWPPRSGLPGWSATRRALSAHQ